MEGDDSFEENADEVEENLTIIVSGLSPSVTKDAVYYYFENSRRSGGGEVLNIDFTDIDNGEAIVTFKEVSGTYYKIFFDAQFSGLKNNEINVS